jgi:hypothetical protein
MSILELFEFTLKFNLAAPDTATWIYVLLTLIFFVFALGWGWGKMWNREWSLGGHVGSLILVLVCALLVAYSIFNLRGISRMEDWFQQQRLTLARSIADSGRFNRSVLTATWDQIVSKSKQEGLTPPSEGGNEILLKTLSLSPPLPPRKPGPRSATSFPSVSASPSQPAIPLTLQPRPLT